MKNFFKDFGLGLKTYGKAFELLFTKGFWWFLLFPVLLNILMFFGGYALIDSLTEFTQNWLTEIISLKNADFYGAEILRTTLSGFIWLVFKVLFFFIFAYFGGYIVIILMSPIFAVLSEKTEKVLTGNSYPFDADQLMRDIVRGVLLAMRNLLIETGFMIVVFFLSFIPLIGQIAAIILFFISCYFYGFSFIDYTNERRRLTLKQSVTFMRQNKGMAIGNGLIFSLFMLIPYCGYTLAGFAAILSVIAATIAVHEKVDLSKNPYAKNKQID
jgi:CysZ protein